MSNIEIFDKPYEEFIISVIRADMNETAVLVKLSSSDIVLMDEVFPNSRIASAHLRDAIGLRGAIEILESAGVQKNDPIWDLNHSGLWDPSSCDSFDI